VRCANEQGFSLHAEVCCAAHQRKKLESQGQGWGLLGAPRTQHCAATSPVPPSPTSAFNRAGQMVLTLKTPYREETTHIVMSPLEFIQRLAALVPRPHLIRFQWRARTQPMIFKVPPLLKGVFHIDLEHPFTKAVPCFHLRPGVRREKLLPAVCEQPGPADGSRRRGRGHLTVVR
jgi:hypothetical protein